jgi:DNA invertase Pin-like site-specific DNA recombinase
MMKFVAYYRVSTEKQGRSGLGLEAQEYAVKTYVASVNGELAMEYKEIESGKKSKRKELLEAIAFCKKNKCKLIIAKLDRLSRDIEFIAKLQKSNLDFICADMPSANRLTINLMSVMAQHEREMISKRTREGLAAAKARGVKLGNKGNLKKGRKIQMAAADEFANTIWEIVEPMISSGMSQQEIADRLNRNGVKTARDGRWSRNQLYRIIQRVEAA